MASPKLSPLFQRAQKATLIIMPRPGPPEHRCIHWYISELLQRQESDFLTKKGTKSGFQTMVAEKVNLSQPKIGQMVRGGDGDMSQETLWKFAVYFKTTPEALVSQAREWWRNGGEAKRVEFYSNKSNAAVHDLNKSRLKA